MGRAREEAERLKEDFGVGKGVTPMLLGGLGGTFFTEKQAEILVFCSTGQKCNLLPTPPPAWANSLPSTDAPAMQPGEGRVGSIFAREVSSSHHPEKKKKKTAEVSSPQHCKGGVGGKASEKIKMHAILGNREGERIGIVL